MDRCFCQPITSSLGTVTDGGPLKFRPKLGSKVDFFLHGRVKETNSHIAVSDSFIALSLLLDEVIHVCVLTEHPMMLGFLWKQFAVVPSGT